MSGKLTREELKGLTAEQKIEYQRKQNAERVAKYRANNKEKSAEYNRTYKKDYINRPENKEKYKELNKMYVRNYYNKLREVLYKFKLLKANKTADKLTETANKGKAILEEGREILQKIQNRRK